MSSRGNTAQTVRLNPYLESELTRLSAESKKSKAEIIRESVEQHLVGESWLAKCDAVLKTSINQVNESHRALEARIERLVNEGAIDFEIQAINQEIAASEERLKAHFDKQIIQTFNYILEKLPPLVVQLYYENQKAATQQRRES